MTCAPRPARRSARVRIGSLPSTAHPLVTTLYYRLKERYPLVQLAVREGQGAQLETWLEDGSVDLAILYRYECARRGTATSTSSRRRPISSAPKATR